MNTDYKIEALAILLDRACVSERYYPLIPCRDGLIEGLKRLGCRRKSDAEKLTDAALAAAGLPDEGAIRLFRRFLAIYDAAPQKFREIDAVTADPAERAAFRELYHLPGVKSVRARLYYRAGYRTVADFAAETEESVREKTAAVIARDALDCIVPLPKEARTHIAVAKAFTL